ncbi:unnamed protein product [Allacma fusca]|uniref:Uncharacterized protein n=1 Tax=Allacma fusca TaxID=39272 RepID=A0A8J2JX66_9HEXA|nr:unnamed protein product [Allacma fusca]
MNGRCEGSYPGKFTFMGNMGSSGIDYVICNDTAAENVQRMEVFDRATEDSQPIQVTIGTPPKPYTDAPIMRKMKLRWIPELGEKFANALEDIDIKAAAGGSPDDIITFINQAIKTASTSVGMTEKPCSTHGSIDKPWFDADCRNAKRRVKKAFTSESVGGLEEGEKYQQILVGGAETEEKKANGHK